MKAPLVFTHCYDSRGGVSEALAFLILLLDSGALSHVKLCSLHCGVFLFYFILLSALLKYVLPGFYSELFRLYSLDRINEERLPERSRACVCSGYVCDIHVGVFYTYLIDSGHRSAPIPSTLKTIRSLSAPACCCVAFDVFLSLVH